MLMFLPFLLFDFEPGRIGTRTRGAKLVNSLPGKSPFPLPVVASHSLRLRSSLGKLHDRRSGACRTAVLPID